MVYVFRLLCPFCVAVLLPLAVLSIQLGGGGLLDVHLPAVQAGLDVSLLIDAQTALNILSKPFNPGEGITECESGQNTNEHPGVTRNGLKGEGHLWYPGINGISTWDVPFVLDPAYTPSQVDIICAGMIDIMTNTCVRFRQFPSEAALNVMGKEDYLYISGGTGVCSSSVGRQHRGQQRVNLQSPGCISHGVVSHELLHAIGFDHQQNTPGRGYYVTINKQNIKYKEEYNFEVVNSTIYEGYTDIPCDYYGKKDFSKNGLDTITVRNGAEIGQRNGLSHLDRYKVNKMYSCKM